MEKWRKVLIQFIKFGIVGLMNTMVSFAIYYMFVFFNPSLYLVGNTVGFIISVANAYYWNGKYVFKRDSNEKKTNPLVRTYIAYGFTYALGTVLLFVMVEYLGISELIAPIINLTVTVPINFALNKFWTYK